MEPVSTTILLATLAGVSAAQLGFGIAQSKKAEEEAEKTREELERKRIAKVRSEVGARAQRLSIIQPTRGQQSSSQGLLGEQLTAPQGQQTSVLGDIFNQPRPQSDTGTAGTF